MVLMVLRIAFQAPLNQNGRTDRTPNLERRTPNAERVSPVDLSKHDIKRSNQRDDVRDEVTLDQAAQALEVAERRRPHAEAIGVRRLAVRHDEVAELAL